LRQLTLSTAQVQDDVGVRLRISVQDEGEGIAKENFAMVFSHGFITRTSGHGFGLHSSALACVDMGGKLTAHSDGPSLGALVVVELPMK
jgi:signal transduction histidine kinase